MLILRLILQRSQIITQELHDDDVLLINFGGVFNLWESLCPADLLQDSLFKGKSVAFVVL